MRAFALLLSGSLLCFFACSKDRDFSGADSTGGGAGADNLGGSAGDDSGSGGQGSGGSNGGGGGGVASLVPAIVTTGLGTAQLNQSYSLTLKGEGGTGALTWSLAEGTLPPGLSLSAAGKLSGTPRVAGSFELTLRVEDAKGKQGTRKLTLVVSRKDWLVYRSDKAERFLTRLYAVQISSALMPVTEIAGGDLPATARVHSMVFSPDGKTLAFVGDTLTDNVYDVYVADMSTKVPGKPKALGFELGSSGLLDWSPNGKRLAVSATEGVLAIDLSEDEPEVKSLGEDGKRGYWLSDTQIGFVRTATPNVYLMRTDWPEGAEPGTPQSLPIEAFCFGATCYEYFEARPDLHVYEYGSMDPSGGMTTKNVLFSATDVAWSTDYSNGPPISPLSRDYKLGVKYDSSNVIGIVELPKPTASKSISDVTQLSRWGNASHNLLVASTSGKFQVVDADAETLSAVDIPGSYGTPDSDHCKHRFSPNDSWVAVFDEASNAYVSKLGAAPGEARKVGSLADRGTFSPDSRFYAFAGDQTNTGAVDLSLVDLSNGAASAPVQQNDRGDTETERDVYVDYAGPCSAHDSYMVDTFFFSPDSSHLVHMVSAGLGGPRYLYVTDLLDATTGELAEGRKGVNRTGNIECVNECTDETCNTYCGTTELDYVFQP